MLNLDDAFFNSEKILMKGHNINHGFPEHLKRKENRKCHCKTHKLKVCDAKKNLISNYMCACTAVNEGSTSYCHLCKKKGGGLKVTITEESTQG